MAERARPRGLDKGHLQSLNHTGGPLVVKAADLVHGRLNLEHVGAALADEMNHRRLSLSRRELAVLVRRADRTLGTKEKTIERWERRGLVPQPAALRALAAVLGKPVD